MDIIEDEQEEEMNTLLFQRDESEQKVANTKLS